MVTLLTVLHIIITISLIFLVLIQDSKGGGMGAFGGGGNSSSVLGATGATSLAAKLTQWFAIAFAVSCILLAMNSGRSQKSVVDTLAPAGAPASMAAGAAASPIASPATTPATPGEAANTTSEQKAPAKK